MNQEFWNIFGTQNGDKSLREFDKILNKPKAGYRFGAKILSYRRAQSRALFARAPFIIDHKHKLEVGGPFH